MNWCITGGCGFIGSNFIRLVLERHPELRITNIDSLTYAGNPANLSDVVESCGERYRFEKVDICDRPALARIFEAESFDAVINFAAESHVDRSIDTPMGFVETNINGTANLVDLARSTGVERFLQVSTDEVYGSLGPTGLFSENSPIDPSSPYSASKASADLLALAAFRTYDQDVVVTRCSNNYGPYQYPEKLIPLMVIKAMRDESLPVYGDGKNVRDWIHVVDHCEGILAVLERGEAGGVYNIGSSCEQQNIDMVRRILELVEKPESLITFVTDRPGHDLRYAIDSSKIENELGWKPSRGFEDGLAETVAWYRDHPEWWEPLV